MAAYRGEMDATAEIIRRVSGILLLVLTGCASSMFAPEPVVLPLGPGSFGYEKVFSQIVTIDYDGKRATMRVEADVSSDSLVVAGISPLGLTLFTLVQEAGKPVVVEAGAGLEGFDPRFILFDMYVTHLPEEVLQNALRGEGLAFERDDYSGTRTVRDAEGEKLVEIHYPDADGGGGETVVRHFDLPYVLHISSLGVDVSE